MAEFIVWFFGLNVNFFIIEKIYLHPRHKVVNPNTKIVEFSGRKGGIIQLILGCLGFQTRATFTFSPLGAMLDYKSPTMGFDSSRYLPLQQKPSVTMARQQMGIIEIVVLSLPILFSILLFLLMFFFGGSGISEKNKARGGFGDLDDNKARGGFGDLDDNMARGGFGDFDDIKARGGFGNLDDNKARGGFGDLDDNMARGGIDNFERNNARGNWQGYSVFFLFSGLFFVVIFIVRWITSRGFMIQLSGHNKLYVCFYQSLFRSEVVQLSQIRDAVFTMRNYIVAASYEIPITRKKTLDEILDELERDGENGPGDPTPPPFPQPDPNPLTPTPTWADMWTEIQALGEQRLPRRFFRAFIKTVDNHFAQDFSENCKNIYNNCRNQLGPDGKLTEDQVELLNEYVDLLRRLPSDQQGGREIVPLIFSIRQLISEHV